MPEAAKAQYKNIRRPWRKLIDAAKAALPHLQNDINFSSVLEEA